jgi:hypothetical protein
MTEKNKAPIADQSNRGHKDGCIESNTILEPSYGIKNNESISNTPLKAALQYAQLGWPVLPCYSIVNSKCSCSSSACKSPGKHPRTMNGLKDASINPQVIKEWWTQWPDANVAVTTGPDSGLAVLDVDVKNGGIENLDLLESEFGTIPKTLVAETGGRGRHYIFKCPASGFKNSAGIISSGIDTRGDRGYILVEPSNHISGRTYSWLDNEPGEIELAEVPEWIHKKLLSKKSQTNSHRVAAGGISEGSRNDFLTSEAGKLRRIGMDTDAIQAALTAVNKKRCNPPLDESEVELIARSVSRYEPADNQAWPELPREALSGLAGEVVGVIEPHSESDPVALLTQFLVAFGNAVGRGPYFTAEADQHFTNLNLCIVGETAKAKKGTSWGHVLRIFKIIDESWAKDCIHSGLSSGEGLVWAIRDEIVKTEPIKKKGGIINGYQEVISDPGISDKRLLAVESEFASVLQVMKRDGNTLSALIRNAWDGKDLKLMTKNSPASSTSPHISIIAHITSDELTRHLDSNEYGNGFANRFLWICARRSKYLPNGGQFQESELEPFMLRVMDAVDFSRNVEELHRDEKAGELWNEVYRKLSDGKPGLLGSVIARSEAQTMRLACLYALLDLSPIIKVEHLQAALALWSYSEQSAQFIFGASTGNNVAETIRRALDDDPEGLSRTEISSGLFKRNTKSQTIARELNQLAKSGFIFESKTTGDSGRSTERWFSTKHRTQ